MMGQSTGWRALAPRTATLALPSFTKDDLFKAARDASTALGLPVSTRAILKELVGFFREMIDGRPIVWPSNAILIERTGLSERQVRYSIRELIQREILTAKDSANGKRFAVRSSAGQILDAFGFDLSPLIGRWEELKIVLAQKRTQKAEDKRLREEVTIIRRTLTEALGALPCSSGIRESTISRMVALQNRAVRDALPEWRILLRSVLDEIQPSTGFGGSDCPLIETNNETPDQSWNNGSEMELAEVVAAVPAALSFAPNEIRNWSDLIRAAETVRGAIGAHRSAWEEAVASAGPMRAALLVMIVAETYSRDAAGAQRIRNAGGYFRAMVRLLAAGRLHLPTELQKLRSGTRSGVRKRTD